MQQQKIKNITKCLWFWCLLEGETLFKWLPIYSCLKWNTGIQIFKVKVCSQRMAAQHGIEESVHCVSDLRHQVMRSRTPATAPRKPSPWPSLTGCRSFWSPINLEVESHEKTLLKMSEGRDGVGVALRRCVIALLILPGPCCPPARLKKESSDEEPMQTDIGESSCVPGPDENPLFTAEALTLNDLKLLSDLFYLPYEHGPTARTMLQELDWLKNHSQAAAAESDEVVLRVCTFWKSI